MLVGQQRLALRPPLAAALQPLRTGAHCRGLGFLNQSVGKTGIACCLIFPCLLLLLFLFCFSYCCCFSCFVVVIVAFPSFYFAFPFLLLFYPFFVDAAFPFFCLYSYAEIMVIGNNVETLMLTTV